MLTQTRRLSFFIASTLFGSMGLRSFAAEPGAVPLRCYQELHKHYGEDKIRTGDYSPSDAEVLAVVLAAKSIEEGNWRYDDKENTSPEMTAFRQFIDLLRNPQNEKGAASIGEQQKVLLPAEEIAHLLWLSYGQGHICPAFHATPTGIRNVFMSLPFIRLNIRNGKIPSLISFSDEARRRQLQDAPSGSQPTRISTATTSCKASSVRTAADTETLPPLPLQEAISRPSAAIPASTAPKTAQKPGTILAPPAPSAKKAVPSASAPKGSYLDDIPDDEDKKSSKPRPKPKAKKGADPFGTLDFLAVTEGENT